jgi:hypothetical protein
VSDASLTVGPSSRPDPQRAWPDTTDGEAPTRAGRLLRVVRKLIDYGKQIAGVLRQGTSPAHITDIRLNFCLSDIPLIISYITRGLHLAEMLEAWAIKLAAVELAPARAPSPPREPRVAVPAEQSAAPPAQRPAKPAADPRLAGLPTLEKLAADIRGRSVGAVLTDICLALGLVPADPLWREVMRVMYDYNGNASALYKAVTDRLFDPSLLPNTAFRIPPVPDGWQPPARPAPFPASSPASFLTRWSEAPWPEPSPPLPAASGADPP